MAKEAAEKKKERRPTALKRDLQNEKRRLINKGFKSGVRTIVRRFEEALEKGDSAVIQHELREVYSVMDQAVKRGVFKKNKASRTKARLTARVAAKA